MTDSEIQIARGFGTELSLDANEDLAFVSRHEHADGILSAITPERKARIAELLKEKQMQDRAQWAWIAKMTRVSLEAATKDLKRKIETFEAAASKLDAATATLSHLMVDDELTFEKAAADLLAARRRWPVRRPDGYSDLEWAVALRQAGGLAPPIPQRVDP